MKIILSLLMLLIPFTAFAEDDVQEQFITVQVSDTGKQVKARITSLGDKGKEAGFDQVRLLGSVKKDEVGYGKRVTVTWSAAELDGDASAIAEPFTSVLIMEGDLNQGMEFKAKGNREALLDAMQNLSERSGEVRPVNNDKTDQTDSSPHTTLSGNTPREQASIEAALPTFTPKEEPFIFITSDGCEILVDEAQGVAIVQQRTLTDGEETSGCSESLTRYPLTRVYNDCPLNEDVESLTVYEQYTVGYVDPRTGGRVEVKGCTRDEDRTISMISVKDGCPPLITNDEAIIQSKLIYYKDGIEHTVASCSPTVESYALFKTNADCSIRHDFEDGLSYQQVKQAYNTDEQTVIVPASICRDDDEQSYPHITTKDTCTPTIADDEVIFNFRKFIEVNGEIMYITECTPDLTKNTPVLSENCTASPYEHDFNTGQSYRKKNYYYMDGDKRVNVLTCVVSEETLTHYQDSGACQVTNDDTTKLSQFYAKTYITESNQPDDDKIYISDCQQLGDPMPYTPAGGIWQAKFNTIKQIKTQGGALSINSTGEYFWSANGQTSELAKKYGWTKKPYGWECLDSKSLCYYFASYPRTATTTNGKYCITNKLQVTDWVTTDNVSLDKANSDQSPEWDWDFTTRTTLNSLCKDTNFGQYSWAWASANDRCTNGDIAEGASRLFCTQPTCTVTTVQKHPVFTRGDGTEFINTAQVAATKYVCGNGSLLDGKHE